MKVSELQIGDKIIAFWTGSFVLTSSFNGATNFLPFYSSSNTLSSSIIYQSGSNILINTTSSATGGFVFLYK